MAHQWHFFRAGGVDQVAIRTGADLLALPELDQKLWVALAMPTRDVAIDPLTMDLLDADNDGRVRVPDILEAVAWIAATWKNPDEVLKRSDRVELSAIKEPAVASAAKRVLSDLGKSDGTHIGLTQVADVVKAFADTTLNGDGIIIPETATDPDTKLAIEEAMAAVGTVVDRSGKPGIDQAKADEFWKAIDEAAAWHQAGANAATMGPASSAAADALAAVKAKLDDYFARTAMVAFDPHALAGMNGQEADFAAMSGTALSSGSEAIARLPLTTITAGKPLALRAGINPAWVAPLASFADHTVAPILGARDSLTSAEYATILDKLAAFVTWRSAKPDTAVAKLDEVRINALSLGDARAKIASLIAADQALEGDYLAIASVEKLCRFQRDFGTILRNFVNFSDFYSRKEGVFQAGTLYLDGRAFRLTVPVSDAAKHGALAGMSAAYLAYCDIKRAGAAPRTIAAALTNGDADNVFVGRNGIFYDRSGEDWDATVTKIVSNPISVREAFYSPYKKLVRMVEETINKRATDADAKAGSKLEGTATQLATIDQPKPVDPLAATATTAPPAAAPAPAGKKPFDVGVIAVISLAIGAVIGALGGLLAVMIGLGVWAPFGIAALLLAISGPSMLLAWMKLRQRNLGPLLDANGWAVNGRARVNVAFGRTLTVLATLPKGATRSVDDPYADKKSHWKLYTVLVVIVVLAASWYAGKLDRFLPRPVDSVQVLGKNAPGYPGSWKQVEDLMKAKPSSRTLAPAKVELNVAPTK